MILAAPPPRRAPAGELFAGPTRGVFKGLTSVRSELSVAVRVGASTPARIEPPPVHEPWISREVTSPSRHADEAQQQQ